MPRETIHTIDAVGVSILLLLLALLSLLRQVGLLLLHIVLLFLKGGEEVVTFLELRVI